ncbi:MAG: transposase [Peptostreptococcaceae bacterium]|nr:transposase [Peptostreptococcaceae bacterium]
MILANKVRLSPTEEQEQKLWQSAGTARFIYNWTLNRQEENHENEGKFISDNDLRKELTILKKTELTWLSEVSNNIAKQAVKDGCGAYIKFFKGLSDKPRFKSRRRSKPSFYNDTSKLKIKESSVLIEKELPVVELTGESIGIDVGIKDLAICSNGMTFKNINKTVAVKQLEKRLRRLQRRVSGKYQKNKEGSKFVKTSNIVKLEKQIRLLHRRLTNIRSNYNHQTTNQIVKTKPSRVVMETLNIKRMMKNKHLSKAIAKQGLSEFKRQMKYKCEFNGIEFVEADKWFPSSKTCSECGHVKEKLSLSERTYICEECGCVIDRDYNASINLSRYELVS